MQLQRLLWQVAGGMFVMMFLTLGASIFVPGFRETGQILLVALFGAMGTMASGLVAAAASRSDIKEIRRLNDGGGAEGDGPN